MRLFKRENSPFWWYDFTIQGERYRDSTKRSFDDKEAATMMMVQEYNRILNKVQFGTKPDISVEDAFARVLKTVTGTTQETYDTMARKWTSTNYRGGAGKWHLPKGLLMSNLTQDLIDDHITERTDEGMKGNSINLESAVMSVVYVASKRRFAVVPDLEFPKVKAFVKTRFLTEWELNQIDMALRKPDPTHEKAYQLFVFLKGTGARRSEALNARWAELNLSKGQFEVYRVKTSSLSLVPLPQDVLSVLKPLHNQKQPFMDMAKALTLLRATIEEVCNGDERVNEQRGKATIHTLRDTYGHRMVSNGLSLHALAKLLGHTTQAMSAKYAQLDHGDVMESARKILAHS